MMVAARDGTQVPVSLAWHKDTPLDGSAPALVYAYGSYGASTDPWFRNSVVSLNGMPFQVVAWSDTQITATVAAGMTSGIVVVTVDNLDSTSGQEAQLFIPAAPVGAPVLNAISPNFGIEGTDQVLVTGFNFGDGTGDVP